MFKSFVGAAALGLFATTASAATVVDNDAYNFNVYANNNPIAEMTTAVAGVLDLNIGDALLVDVNFDLGPEVAIVFGDNYDFNPASGANPNTEIKVEFSGLDFGGANVVGFNLDPSGLYQGVVASVIGDTLQFTFADQLVNGQSGDLLAGGSFVVSAVPLPASALMLLSAVGAVGAFRLRRKSKS